MMEDDTAASCGDTTTSNPQQQQPQQQTSSSSALLQQALLSPSVAISSLSSSCSSSSEEMSSSSLLLLLHPQQSSPSQQQQPQPPPQQQQQRSFRTIRKYHQASPSNNVSTLLPRIDETQTSVMSYSNDDNNNESRNEAIALNNTMMMTDPPCMDTDGSSHHDGTHNNTIINNNSNSSSYVETSFTLRNFWSTFLIGGITKTKSNSSTNNSTTTSTDQYHNDTTIISPSLIPNTISPSRRIIRRRQWYTTTNNNNNNNNNNNQILLNNTDPITSTLITTQLDNSNIQQDAAIVDNMNHHANNNYNNNNNTFDDDDDDNNNDDSEFRNHHYNNHNNNNDDNEILYRCYFWSFLFSSHHSQSHNHDGMITLSGSPPQPQHHTLSMVQSLFSCILVFLGITIFGIHSIIQIQNNISTDFESLFSRTTSTYYRHNHSNNTSPIYNNPLPIIVVLSSGSDEDWASIPTTTTTTTTTTTHNCNETKNNKQYYSCRPNTKISHRGTLEYKYGQEFTTGLEQYLLNRIQNETESSPPQQSNSTFTTSNNLTSNTTTTTTIITPTITISSFYSYMSQGLEWWARNQMATPDGTSVLMLIQYSITTTNNNNNNNHLFKIKNTNHDSNPNLFTSPSSTMIIMKQEEYRLRHLLINAIDDYKDQFYKQYDNKNLTTPLCMTIHPTGIPYLEERLTHSLHRLTRIVVLLVLPVVIVLLSLMMWYLYNAVLFWIWIVPFVSIVMSISTVCIIVQYIMIVYIPASVTIFSPFMMILMSLATSAVHNVSLLSRYLEEMGGTACTTISRSSSSRAIRRTLMSSGSIMISTGCISVVILMIFSIGSTSALCRSILIGIMIATVTTSCICFVIFSTMLGYTPLGHLVLNKYEDYGHQPTHNDDAGSSHHRESDRYNLLAEPFAAQILPTPRNSIWFCIARNIVHPYRAVILILVILQLLLPVAFHVKRAHLSFQPMNLLSANGSEMDAYKKLGQRIGYGRLYPYRILFDGRSSNMSLTSKVGFELMHSIINEVQSRSLLPWSPNEMLDAYVTNKDEKNLFNVTERDKLSLPTNVLNSTQVRYDMFNGIAVIQNTLVTYDMFLAAKYCSPPTRSKNYCPLEFLRMIAATNEYATSNDTFETYIQVELGKHPFSSEGIDWLKNARYKIDRLRQASKVDGAKVDIVGSGELVYDSVIALHKPVHVLMYISAMMAAIFLTIFTRSIFLPIPSALTICLKTSFSLGLAVYVYQNGILNVTKIPSLQSNTENGALCWLVPQLAIPVIVGLCLIFDNLLMSRVLEFREQGYDHKSSIALGIDVVGGCNTCAGMIIVFIFIAPMLFGENVMLFQWSFVLVSAILVDTLIVRTIIIPVCIGSVSFCWWPRKLPPELYSLEEFNFRNPLQVDDSIGDNPNTYWETLITSSEYEPLNHNR